MNDVPSEVSWLLARETAVSDASSAANRMYLEEFADLIRLEIERILQLPGPTNAIEIEAASAAIARLTLITSVVDKAENAARSKPAALEGLLTIAKEFCEDVDADPQESIRRIALVAK